MPIKNYSTSVPAQRSIEEVTRALVKAGAIGVLSEYEPGTGRISGLSFRLALSGGPVAFSLPVNWRAFQAVLKRQGVRTRRNAGDDNEFAYRVAWRCLRDWVLAQLALYETQMVDLPQVFLPFATVGRGQTMYEAVKARQWLLPEKAGVS